MHGIARYALELSRRVPALAPEYSFSALAGPDGLPPALAELEPSIPLHRCSQPFLSPLEQPSLARSLFRIKPTLFHATSFSVPAFWPGRLVATLHDANHLEVPESKSKAKTAYYRLVVAPRVKRARAIVTVSEFSRKRLSAALHMAEERFQVIFNGVDSNFSRRAPKSVEQFKAKHQLPARFVAVVGNLKAFKNVAILRDIATRFPVPLVLLCGVGAKAHFQFSDNVIELAPLAENELATFYSAATAVLFPSRYEGFGLPALEAMACGTPVIASTAGALKEVVGSAGLLVDPSDAFAWLDTCQKLLRDNAMQQSLVQLGLERVSRFSWDDCAQRTVAVYRRALG